MRLLSLVALVATLMWSCEAGINSDKIAISKIDSNIDFLELTADNQKDQTKRSLRRYDDNSMGEERGTGKLDDAAEKIIHVTQKRKFPKELITAVEKNLDDLVAAAAKATVAQKYSSKLSSRTLQQLEKIEILRSKDIASYSKKTGDGMRRKMTIGKDTKVAPILSSHVGRGNQHYEGKRRLLTCSVVSRRAEDGGGDVLLISSSNPNKNEFILPKGGWDHGETVGKSAWREVIEEGGVSCHCSFYC
uniref:RxLR effector protein n=1 Tax=Phytophthora agathidicida TaxID=1642459 RepID=A0A7G4WI04_9STRA|nr:PaRXLR15 [Phytophthora agathidicida]